MDTNENFSFVRLFTSALSVEGHTFLALVVTAVSNTGIYQTLCTHTLQVGLTRCLTTLLQERGRLVRKEGKRETFTLASSFPMSLLLVLSVMSPLKDLIDVLDHFFATPVINSRSVERQHTFAESNRPTVDQLRLLTQEENTANIHCRF